LWHVVPNTLPVGDLAMEDSHHQIADLVGLLLYLRQKFEFDSYYCHFKQLYINSYFDKYHTVLFHSLLMWWLQCTDTHHSLIWLYFRYGST